MPKKKKKNVMMIIHDKKDLAGKIKSAEYRKNYILHHCRPRLDLASDAANSSNSSIEQD